jgi:hypothetical protein
MSSTVGSAGGFGAPGTSVGPDLQRSAAPRRSVGLTGLAVVLLPAVLGVLGGMVDVIFTGGLGLTYAVMFLVGCVAAALFVRRPSMPVAVIAPPLVHSAVLVAVSVVTDPGAASGWVTQRAWDVANGLLDQAGLIWLATGASAVIVGLRYLAMRALDARRAR